MNVACVYRPQFPAAQLAEAARAAEAAGLREMWLWEDCFLHGGIASAAVVLANSESLVVGLGVLPVPLRNVALTAMEVSTLEGAFPGRTKLGVGHGVQDWMRQVGERVASPMTLLREHLTCLRALLDGELVSFDGRYVSLDAVQLDWPPPQRVPLFAAATGPKTLRLSGELADGTVLTGDTGVAELRSAVELIDADASHEVVVYVRCTDMSPSAVGAVAATVGAYRDAGAHTVALQCDPEADVFEFIRFVGAVAAA